MSDQFITTIDHALAWAAHDLRATSETPRLDAELLLAHAADVTARSRNANANTPLHAALAANQKLVAGLLIGGGADLNAADGAGWRPLHLAAANNNLDVMKTLIAQGADVSVNNGEGLTALGLAQKRNHLEAVALLQRHGAK